MHLTSHSAHRSRINSRVAFKQLFQIKATNKWNLSPPERGYSLFMVHSLRLRGIHHSITKWELRGLWKSVQHTFFTDPPNSTDSEHIKVKHKQLLNLSRNAQTLTSSYPAVLERLFKTVPWILAFERDWLGGIIFKKKKYTTIRLQNRSSFMILLIFLTASLLRCANGLATGDPDNAYKIDS